MPGKEFPAERIWALRGRGQCLGVVQRCLDGSTGPKASRPRPSRPSGWITPGHSRRIISLSRQPLQPLPGSGPLSQYARKRYVEHRFPGRRLGPIPTQDSARRGTLRHRGSTVVKVGTKSDCSPVQWVRRRGRTEALPPPGQEGAPAPRPDPYLVKALRRAHQVLAQNGGCPVGRPEQALPGSAPDGPYERRLIRLAFLAPDLQAKILEGRQPRGLTLKALLRWEPPADWRSQRAEFEALG